MRTDNRNFVLTQLHITVPQHSSSHHLLHRCSSTINQSSPNSSLARCGPDIVHGSTVVTKDHSSSRFSGFRSPVSDCCFSCFQSGLLYVVQQSSPLVGALLYYSCSGVVVRGSCKLQSATMVVRGVVAGGRRLLSPKWQAFSTCHLRGLSLAADASSTKEVPPVVPQMPSFDFTPQPYDGPKADEILAKRKKFLNPALFLYYKKPLNIVEGKMQYLFDESGRRYLDAFAGIVTVSVGHCHPVVVDAVVKQTKLLQHTTTIYLHHAIANYAEALAQRMPGNLKVVYFVNSGSEANDMAMMMARLYTGSFDVVALRNCYHGMSPATMGLTAHSTWKYNVAQGFGVHHAMNPDPYRGPFGADGKLYANDLANLLESATPGRIAGFFHETIQGVGGAVELAPGYLPAAYDIVRKAGGLCIADEVQTGFGRTGSNYWGFQNQGVTPDIVTLAKGIGNGLPLAAVVTTPEVAQVMSQRLHFNTYGGNPVCSAAGHAVLEVLDKEKRQEHCAMVGDHLLHRLRALQEKHDIIGNVRGRGLMLGVELVKDRESKIPAKEETLHLFEELKDLGILVGKGGLHGNVFRIKPPMCFSMEDADFLVDGMDHVMSKL